MNFSSTLPTDKIAFFDLDKTLLAFDCHLLFINFFLQERRKNRLPNSKRTHMIFYSLFPLAMIGYALRLIDVKTLKCCMAIVLWKLPRKTVVSLCQTFIKHHVIPLLFPEILALIRHHTKRGHCLVLTSGSLDIYVKPLAKQLGFHHYFATRLCSYDCYPLFSKIIGKNNIGQAKLEHMQIDSHKRKNLPNNETYAYSDHPKDRPLLSLAKYKFIITSGKKHQRFIKEEQKNHATILYPYNRYRKRHLLLQLLGKYYIHS